MPLIGTDHCPDQLAQTPEMLCRPTHMSTQRDLSADQQALLAVCKAFAHPIRILILMALLREGMASSVQIADYLDLPPNTVRHHTTSLLALSMIELAAEAPVRGAIERFYRLSRSARDALPFLRLVSGSLRTRDDAKVLSADSELAPSDGPYP
jgi:DNA-binding transcriptional ArsR family regulator